MVCDRIDLFELLKQGISMHVLYCCSCLCIVNSGLVQVYCDSQDYQ